MKAMCLILMINFTLIYLPYISFVAVFGLGTLIFIGLEIAMHATMNKTDCVDNIVIAHPILQVLTSIIFYDIMTFKYLFYIGSVYLPTDALPLCQLYRDC